MLEVKNVSYSYKTNKDVLKKINVNFEHGNLYCIAGKSGSGKTTFLSLISGLDVVKDGDILVDGASIKSMDLDHYRSQKIGVIFQAYNLLTQVSALDNILLSMEISKVKDINKREHALALLEKVGIDSIKAKRKVIELSGGEQQRIAIARALSYSPDYIFADEPTGNLDSETEKLIMDIFQKLVKEENKCVVIVTHSKSVTRYADHVYKMHKGKLTDNEGR